MEDLKNSNFLWPDHMAFIARPRTQISLKMCFSNEAAAASELERKQISNGGFVTLPSRLH